MRKPSYKLTLVAGLAALALSGASVLAVSPNAHAEEAQTTATDRQATAQEKRDATKTKLAAAKLKVCQKRETAINNIMARNVDRATKQIGVFDTIATRTEKFYTDKGKTVANYTALVKAVNDAKAKAEADLDTMKTTDTFKCDSDDPKGAVKAFKDNLKLEIADLKAYKTAVKNLIVGVKSAQSAESKASPSASPTAQGGNQ